MYYDAINEIVNDSFLLVDEGHGAVDKGFQGIDVASKEQKNVITIVGGDLCLKR
jgi:hypothetical protein